ncbi:hypothetical protein QJQ45_016937, partial [Haematococcus lacustris]
VFLSIQSLILVDRPYFNEPGYERTMGTPQGEASSRSYNVTIREATLRYAMIDLLKHPPAELEAIIKTHFRARRLFQKAVAGWRVMLEPEYLRHKAERTVGLAESLAYCNQMLLFCGMSQTKQNGKQIHWGYMWNRRVVLVGALFANEAQHPAVAHMI